MGSGGGSAAPNVASILFGTSWENSFQWYFGDYYQTTMKGGTKDQNRHLWDMRSGSQKIDGIEYATESISPGITPGPNFILFARRLAEKNAVDSYHPAQIYGCKIYDGETLLRDFQPCFLNGKYCLKDAVTGKYFYANEIDGNSGYGVNELGGAPIDVSYKKLFYLHSSGTQYIDTRVKIRSDTRVWVKMSFDAITDQYQCMGWAYQDKCSLLLGPKCSSDGKFGGWFGPNYKAPLSYELPGDTEIHEWDLSSGSQKIDGVEYSTQTATSDLDNNAAGHTFFLFARNRQWDLNSPDWFSKARIYGVKIWKGETLLRDYVAAEVGGRACLYDRVSKLPFFSPVGSEFSGSPVPLVITVR